MKKRADSHGLSNVRWHGVIPMNQVPFLLNKIDCLVLPSRQDGWGAVVSEALLSGCRVICSDACGSASVAQASDVGYVFKSGDLESLSESLCKVIKSGIVTETERNRTRKWAQSSISNVVGAIYLAEIIQSNDGKNHSPPWIGLARNIK
jgi:glycosyltransferase involved in cell wall biosynthesis